MQRDEKQLILLLRDESTRREAFAEVVRTYQEPLYRMVRRIVLIHEDADDVLQNTFIKAWQGLDKFRGDSSLGTWLYRIASHEALDHLERNKRLCASIDDDEHPGHMSWPAVWRVTPILMVTRWNCSFRRPLLRYLTSSDWCST